MDKDPKKEEKKMQLLFFGIKIYRQKCAFNPQSLSALLFSGCSANTQISHSLFPHLIPAGPGGKARTHLLGWDLMLISGSEGYNGRHEMGHHASEQCELSRRK